MKKIKQEIDEDIRLTDFEAEVIDRELTKIKPMVDYIIRRYINFITRMK